MRLKQFWDVNISSNAWKRLLHCHKIRYFFVREHCYISSRIGFIPVFLSLHKQDENTMIALYRTTSILKKSPLNYSLQEKYFRYRHCL